jgi:Cu2+-containing amine oxidase
LRRLQTLVPDGPGFELHGWRHALQARRARTLVLTAYATIDNYDYAFNWIFVLPRNFVIKD